MTTPDPALDVAAIESEYALLCCFGAELNQKVPARRLHTALVGIGFRPAAARHTVRSSPLLTRCRDGAYRLLPAGPDALISPRAA